MPRVEMVGDAEEKQRHIRFHRLELVAYTAIIAVFLACLVQVVRARSIFFEGGLLHPAIVGGWAFTLLTLALFVALLVVAAMLIWWGGHFFLRPEWQAKLIGGMIVLPVLLLVLQSGGRLLQYIPYLPLYDAHESITHNSEDRTLATLISNDGTFIQFTVLECGPVFCTRLTGVHLTDYEGELTPTATFVELDDDLVYEIEYGPADNPIRDRLLIEAPPR